MRLLHTCCLPCPQRLVPIHYPQSWKSSQRFTRSHSYTITLQHLKVFLLRINCQWINVHVIRYQWIAWSLLKVIICSRSSCIQFSCLLHKINPQKLKAASLLSCLRCLHLIIWACYVSIFLKDSKCYPTKWLALDQSQHLLGGRIVFEID